MRPALNVIQPLNSGAGNPATPPVAKVKNPVTHFTGTELFSKLKQNCYTTVTFDRKWTTLCHLPYLLPQLSFLIF